MLVVTPARAEPGPAIHWNPAGEPRARFEVVGLEPTATAALAQAEFSPDQWSGLFAVYVVPANAPLTNSQLPILGKYRVSAGVLQFEPRFPLEPGLVYRARFDPTKLPGARGRPKESPIVVAEFSCRRNPPRRQPA